MAQKWEMLIANRKPRKNINRELFGSSGNDPPVLLYGWPFTKDYFIEYAKRHRLSAKLAEQTLQRLDCPTEGFNFGDLTEKHYRDENLVTILRSAAILTSTRHLRDSIRVAFQIGRPLSLEWDKILFVWTNYNYEEKYRCNGLALKGRFERAKKFVNEAMNECFPEGKRTELRW